MPIPSHFSILYLEYVSSRLILCLSSLISHPISNFRFSSFFLCHSSSVIYEISDSLSLLRSGFFAIIRPLFLIISFR